MGKTTGFLEYERKVDQYEAIAKRVKHFKEFTIPLKEKEMKEQGARCMDCGIPFCHSGCPLGNLNRYATMVLGINMSLMVMANIDQMTADIRRVMTDKYQLQF